VFFTYIKDPVKTIRVDDNPCVEMMIEDLESTFNELHLLNLCIIAKLERPDNPESETIKIVTALPKQVGELPSVMRSQHFSATQAPWKVARAASSQLLFSRQVLSLFHQLKVRHMATDDDRNSASIHKTDFLFFLVVR
jgi:hypothetical protein